MVKKKLQQTVNINNYGINNGIIANNVIVPENSDLPIVNNYTITRITDFATIERIKSKFIYELKPKQGVWYKPFIGWPQEGDSIVKGEMRPSLANSYSLTGGGGSVTYSNGEIKIKFKHTYSSEPIPIGGAIYFICQKPPKALIFGDLNDKRHQYIVYFF